MSIRSKKRSWQNETAKWKVSLNMSEVTHQVGTYSGFCSMYQVGVFLLPSSPLPLSGGMLVHRQVTCTSQYYLPVPIYPPEWKEAVRVKCPT